MSLLLGKQTNGKRNKTFKSIKNNFNHIINNYSDCSSTISKHQKKELITTPELIHLKFEDTIKNNILFSDIRIDKQEEYFYITSKATNIISNNLKISPITITLEDNQVIKQW